MENGMSDSIQFMEDNSFILSVKEIENLKDLDCLLVLKERKGAYFYVVE
jgi:hypothetical protein